MALNKRKQLSPEIYEQDVREATVCFNDDCMLRTIIEYCFLFCIIVRFKTYLRGKPNKFKDLKSSRNEPGSLQV